VSLQDWGGAGIQLAKTWETGLRVGVSTCEEYLLIMYRLLTNPILAADQSNPCLSELKDDVATAGKAVDLAICSVTTRRRIQALNQAVFALIHDVEFSKGSAANHVVIPPGLPDFLHGRSFCTANAPYTLIKYKRK